MAFWRHAGVIAVLLCAGCSSKSQRASLAEEPSFIDGTWEGAFTTATTDEKGSIVKFPVNLKLTIDGDTARVFVRRGSDLRWQDQSAEQPFVVDKRGTNAVIYANRAGKTPTPKGSRWFETYLLAVTLKSQSQLLVHWLRVVNNIDTPVDDPDHAGTSAGDGVLRRK